MFPCYNTKYFFLKNKIHITSFNFDHSLELQLARKMDHERFLNKSLRNPSLRLMLWACMYHITNSKQWAYVHNSSVIIVFAYR